MPGGPFKPDVDSVCSGEALDMLTGQVIGALRPPPRQRGQSRRLGGEADDVAAAIERALLKQSNADARAVTPSARLLIGLRRVLPDHAWDRVIGRQYGA